jgi:hypothetical protein
MSESGPLQKAPDGTPAGLRQSTPTEPARLKRRILSKEK